MSAYELQTYQSGQWKFDSYYDDRDLVMSEASRMDHSGKYMGVRVLEETFVEETQTAKYATIYSRLKKVDQGANSSRSAPQPGARKPAARGGASSRKITRKPKKKKSGGGTFRLIFVSLFLLLLGIGALFMLRSLAEM